MVLQIFDIVRSSSHGFSVLEETQQEAWTGQRNFDEHTEFLVILDLRISKVTERPMCKTWTFQVDLPVTDRLPFNIFVLATTHVPQANPKLHVAFADLISPFFNLLAHVDPCRC